MKSEQDKSIAGFKATKLGRLPKEWDVRHLSDIADLRGRIGWKGLTTEDYVSEGPLLLGVRNITPNQRLDLTNLTRIPIEKYNDSPEIMLKNGYLLLAKTGATIGKSCVIDDLREKATVNAAVNVIECRADVNNYFLNYFISSKICQNQMWAAASPGAQPNLFQREINRILVVVPSIKEQKAIVDILSTWDRAIEKTEQLIAQKQQFKKGLMQRLLTGKVRFKEFVKSKRMKKTKLGMVPEDWAEERLANCVTKVGSGITPSGGGVVYKTTGRVFVRSQNIGNGNLLLDDVAFIDENTHQSFFSTEIFDHDVLLNITGASIGRCAVADNRVVGGNVNQHVCIIRVTEALDPHFLKAYLLSEFGQNQIDSFQAGGNRQGLNFEQIKSFRVPLPSTREQRRISAVMRDVDREIEQLTSTQNELQSQKKGLMQQLLTGKVRVKH